jgi:drug/metabolite transporter (DMT)-like permease
MLGEALSLGSALSWALAVVLFKRALSHSPAATNLFKNVLAIILLGATALALEIPWPDRSPENWARLAISGICGIAIADTLFFASLSRVGAGFMGIIECAYAPFVVLFSVLLLGERLSMAFGIGALAVVAGVLIAGSGELSTTSSRKELGGGFLMGIGSVALMGFGIVLAKPALETSHVVEASLTRLVFGTGALAVWILARPRAREVMSILTDPSAWRTLGPAAFIGTYVTMLLWIGGMKHAEASVSGILCQLSTVFTLALGALILKEKLSKRHWAGAALAMVGALGIIVAQSA